MKNFHSATIAVILGSFLLVNTGCGKAASGLPAVHPTTGQLQYEGQPLAGAFVVLHPKSATDPAALPARGTTDAQGNFQLSTFNANDGAIAGEYFVTVEYSQLVPDGADFIRTDNLVPSQYQQPQTTELQVQVAEGTNQIPVLNLHR